MIKIIEVRSEAIIEKWELFNPAQVNSLSLA